MPRTDTLDAQIEALTTELRQKETEKNRIALALSENADDANLADDLQLIDEVTTAIKKRIALFESARSAATSRDEQDAATTKLGAAIAARDKAVQLAKNRAVVGKQIDEQVAGLGNLLQQWNDTSKACTAQTLAVVSSVIGPLDARLDNIHVMRGYSGSKVIASPLGAALLKAGVHEVGDSVFDLLTHFTINPNGSCQRSAEDCAEQLATRLDEVLRGA